MAKNGKNRLAILTIFRFRRTDVKKGGELNSSPFLRGIEGDLLDLTAESNS
jgi:hypothetical protein